jgi:hypothetical protein
MVGYEEAVEVPLTREQRAEAMDVALRLVQELRSVLTRLPDSERGASALSRSLNMDRITCQRIVGPTNRREIGPDTLAQLPGIQGLRQFLGAMAQRSGNGAAIEDLAAAGAAVDRFARFLQGIGGSQRRLRFRLEADEYRQREWAGASPDDQGREDRESLFRAAAAVTRRWSETLFNIRAVRPAPGNPRLTEGLVIRGMLGHTARADAVPLEMGEAVSIPARRPDGAAYMTLERRPASGATPTSLLPEFCSEPLPRITSRAAGDRVVHQIDPAEGASGLPMDLVMAHVGSQPDQHPATRRPALGEMWFLITFPACRLVFDVFLHRDIACRCIPSLSTHLWGPDVVHWGSSRWSTRFPGGLRLAVLGQGVASASTPGIPRHAEMLTRVFGEVGWNPDEFTGYRCEVMFPLWRAGYCMLFDFTGNELPAWSAEPAGR